METFHKYMYDNNFTFFDRKDIIVKDNIGSGYIGEVFTGSLKLLDNEQPVVIKRIRSNFYDKGIHDEYLFNDVKDEVRIARLFMDKAKQLIRFYGYSCRVTEDEICLYIIMEKTSADYDLAKHIYSDCYWKKLTKEEYDVTHSNLVLSHNGKYWEYIMSQKNKYDIMISMATAVKELHSYNIVHCDLKPHNMLFTDKGITIIDFNASCYMGKETEHMGKREQGTPGYMAKELYRGYITYSSDIYSLGVSFLEVWFGDIWPKQTDRYSKCRKYVLDYLSLLSDNKQLHDLISKMVHTQPTRRPKIDGIINSLTMLNK